MSEEKKDLEILQAKEKSNKEDSVDIVVLSYNGLSVNNKFLENIYKNTNIEDFNLYWVDNNSTDGTKDLLTNKNKEANNLTVIFSPKNLGVIEGRNTGCNYVLNQDNKAKYLLYIDNDQIPQKGWLESHMNCLKSNNLDIIGVEAWIMNMFYIPVERIKNKGNVFNYVGCGGMLIKKDVIKKIGMFDPIFSPAYFEDPDFCWRAYKDGYKIGWNPEGSQKIIHLAHQTLGKLTNKEKSDTFIKSLTNFKNKWKGHSFPSIR